jgi:peptide-methionine (R)-S-oxide reductase
MGTTRRGLLTGGALGIMGLLGALGLAGRGTSRAAESFPYQLDDAAWRQKLTPEAYAVLRREATERPFTSALLDEHRRGTFTCAGCDQDLFASDTKFDSGTGWPSFWKPLDGAVGTREDSTFGMTRTEVHCSRCGGHLGHVFDDGPPPTGLRYCMNGVSLGFRPAVA